MSVVEGLLAGLADVGRDPRGGYARSAWTREDLALREWFVAQALARGLDVVVDRAGNQWAWWGDPDADGPGVVTGSHLDSVPGGGAYDGPLGVTSAFAAVDALRADGLTPAVPLGVVCFSDEEGARFGLACVGSRVATGTVPAATALALRDGDGVTLADALRSAGRPVDGPLGLGPDPEAMGRVGTFVELHVEQGRLLTDLREATGTDAPVAVGSGIWPHGRWRADLCGDPNHAGTTPLHLRRDPMLDLADLVVSTRAAAERHAALATVGKVSVDPNGVNAIPSQVTAWVDARGQDEHVVRGMLADLARFDLRQESWTPATHFDEALSDRVAALVGGPGGVSAPVLRTGAGHDAGILSGAGVPTAMLFVRNVTGVSHAPDEHAEPADCRAGVSALSTVLSDLCGARSR